MRPPRPVGHILDAAGEPVPTTDMVEYGRFLACDSSRRIAEEEVNGHWISTVFVGDRYPMCWETLCVDSDGVSKYQIRYGSRAEAEVGHKRMVEQLKGLIDGH